ncbi:MAG: HAMP domain-containing sensor histidine kinase [Bacteroidota bacterium]
MDKNKVLIFSAVAVFALTGIISTQIVWVHNTLILHQQLDVIMYRMYFLVVTSVLFLIFLSISFYMIIRLMFRQKKLSQIQTDFINNITHEFKTPIATISLSSEMLLNSDVNKFPHKTKRYAKVISDENNRLEKQVEQILQLSIIEKDESSPGLKEINVHEIISGMVGNHSIFATQQGGTITTDLKAVEYFVMADKTHLSNIIANLLDNALKYTHETPKIKINTLNKQNKIMIYISDNGVGISNEHQKQVFNKLYRVPTGNIHDVKGFGLGLYYVKTMIEAYGGEVGITSAPGDGTTINITLPTKHKS